VGTPRIHWSGYHPDSYPVVKGLFEQYNCVHFCYQAYAPSWMGITRTYAYGGVKWLLSLPFRLINGGYHLFMTSSTIGPEAIVTFILSKMLRKPIIVMESHWYWPKTFISQFLWPFARLLAYHATVLGVVGLRAKKYWESAGIPNQKMKIIHWNVSTIRVENKNIIKAKELREKLGNKKVILFLGRLIKRKGVEYLINAFAKLSGENRDVILLIVGEGEEKRHLEKLCKGMKLKNVFFAGFANDEAKASYFLLSDVLVHPAVTIEFPEEWGLVVNEAMSLGKPVVVTNSTGCAYDLVKNGINGYIVPEKDIDALYRAIKAIISDEKLRGKMGMMSNRIIEEAFTYDHAVKGLERAIKTSLKLNN